jgi:ABC-type hemin transport system substrate-binding protein
MTINEQVALATDKVAHWNSKRDHALAMLTKWQGRLSALQSKGKPQPTAKKLPPVALVAEGSGDKVVPINGKAKPAKAKPPKKH